MNFEISGNLIVKEDVQNISSSFKKREFVIEVLNERNSEWNDFIKFQITQDKCSLLDAYQVGQSIKVAFNIRGRKWEKDGKTNYFSNLEAWRIEAEGNSTAAPQANEAYPAFQATDIPAAEEGDDLPF